MGCNCNHNLNMSSISQVIHGAVEVLKTHLNIDVAPFGIALSRARVCKDCEHKTNVMIGPLKFCQCNLCKCLISEKVKRANESCPDKRWSAIK